MQKVSDGTLTTNRAKSTTVAFDPSGNVCTRFLYNATPPADVAVYDAYGRAINDVSFSLGTSFSYPASSAYSIGFGAQFGYYTESNTKLASSDNGDWVSCSARSATTT